MAKYTLSKTDKLQINYFIIRETYKFMAKLDKIPHAMNRFYRYLEIEPNNYDKLVQLGVGSVDKTVNALVKCGYSDTLFRKDSPTLIKTSELLLDSTYEYIFFKNISLEEYQADLGMYLSTIMNTDDTLLVVCTRKLINNIYSVSEPDETLMDFMDMLDDMEYSGHTLQKEIMPDILKSYKEYKENLPNNQKDK
ncbi:MAG: hypothetical protein IJZ42_04500 [Lachnospiraceae bacterium]|nr:hypothetical protein [Lachnospiraceae bacterium]